jgi:hypothetical protein
VTDAGAAPLDDVEVTAYQWHVAEEWWQPVAWSGTDGSGDYDLGGLPAGTYRIGFGDYDGAHVAEYWDDSVTVEGADDVTVSLGGTVTGRERGPDPHAVAVTSRPTAKIKA